jgi:hypothetical protein
VVSEFLDLAGDARSQETEIRSQESGYMAAADKNIDWIYYA